MAGPNTTRRSFLVASGSAVAAVAAGCLGAGDEPGRYTTPAAEAFDGVVDGAWLEEREDVAILDVRGEEAFAESRVAGARRLSETIREHYEDTGDGYEASPEAVAGALEDAGVAPDAEVVVYGEETSMWATHGAYTLEAIGHEGPVRVLDGGLSAWADADGETESDAVAPVDDGPTYEADLDLDVLATREYVAERVREGGADVDLVDNRTPEEYLGADGGDGAERRGHIPGAVNVNFPQNFEDGRFRTPDDLERLWLEEAGLDPEAELIHYCSTGVRASVGWFVTKQLGWDDAKVYDGSWGDWGNLSEADGYPYVSDGESGTVVDTFA